MESLLEPKFLLYCFFVFTLSTMFGKYIRGTEFNSIIKIIWMFLWTFCAAIVWTFIR